MKKWDREIHVWKIHILLTNYLKLGFSIRRTPRNWFHINLWTCQIEISKPLTIFERMLLKDRKRTSLTRDTL